MAASNYTNLAIHSDEFYDGMFEYVTQNLGAFNAASNNAIVLESFLKKGHYSLESFFSSISGVVTRRDITSADAATIVGPSQSEIVAVKLNGKIGPVDLAVDALRKGNIPMDEFSYYLGQQVGLEKTKYELNSVLSAGTAACLANADATVDGTAAVISYSAMVDTMAKMGDAGTEVVAWVMHSKVYYDLVKAVITDKLFDLTSFTVYTGTPITFGRPVIVTDCPSLTYTATGTKYRTLALTTRSLVCNESERDLINGSIITGAENLVFRYQGEFAFNVEVKGHAWDQTNGGINPAAAALATSTNWDRVCSSVKLGPGVVLNTL